MKAYQEIHKIHKIKILDYKTEGKTSKSTVMMSYGSPLNALHPSTLLLFTFQNNPL